MKKKQCYILFCLACIIGLHLFPIKLTNAASYSQTPVDTDHELTLHEWYTMYDNEISVGWDGGISSYCRGMIKFDLTGVSGTVTAASLEFQVYFVEYGDDFVDVSVTEITQFWNPELVEWANKPNYDPTELGSKLIDTDGAIYNIPLTVSKVQAWVDAQGHNGIYLMMDESTQTGLAHLYSIDYPGSYGSPRLLITTQDASEFDKVLGFLIVTGLTLVIATYFTRKQR